jgi:hypothetical protein
VIECAKELSIILRVVEIDSHISSSLIIRILYKMQVAVRQFYRTNFVRSRRRQRCLIS